MKMYFLPTTKKTADRWPLGQAGWLALACWLAVACWLALAPVGLAQEATPQPQRAPQPLEAPRPPAGLAEEPHAGLEPSSGEAAQEEPLEARDPWPLKRAVAQALEANPGLAGARARAAAMMEMAQTAGGLPNPTLMYGWANVPTDSWSTSADPMTMNMVGINQMFPFWGKRDAREGEVRNKGLALEERFRRTRLELVRQVYESWWRLYYLDRSLEINRRSQRLVGQLVQVASTKYKVGRGLQQDVMMARLEKSRLMAMELELTQMRQSSLAMLNGLLHRPPQAPLTPPPLEEAALEALVLRANGLAARWGLGGGSAVEASAKEEVADTAGAGLNAPPPMVAMARHNKAAAQEGLALAQLNWWPDLMVGVEYGKRPGPGMMGPSQPDTASLKLGFTLPLYNVSSQASLVAARQRELAAADHELAQAQDQSAAMARAAMAQLENSLKRAELYKSGIIPQAQQTLSSMHSGYQVNKVDFRDLIQSQMMLNRFETEYWKAVAESQQALAAWAEAVGFETLSGQPGE